MLLPSKLAMCICRELGTAKMKYLIDFVANHNQYKPLKSMT